MINLGTLPPSSAHPQWTSRFNSCNISTINFTPHHHDWPLLLDDQFSLQVHWFARFAGFPEWQIERARLTAHMLSFFYVEKSECHCELNGITYRLKQDELLIIRGGDEFSFSHDPQQPVSILSACLALGQGNEPNTLLHRQLPRRQLWPDPHAYQSEFHKTMLVMSDSASVGNQLRSSGAILQWLGYILKTLDAPLSTQKHSFAERSVVEKVLQSQRWATENLVNPIRLDDWASSVGLGAIYFGRVYKKETGKRPMQWLNDRRLQLASRLLRLTGKPIYVIAEECGFSCPFYFSRSFQKKFGISPSQFRKKEQL